MAYKCDTVTISYVHVDVLEEPGGAGDCLTLGGFQDCGEVPYHGWQCDFNGEISMLIFFNDVGVVTEALTAKELVKFLWGELYVTPALFHIWIVSWADVW